MNVKPGYVGSLTPDHVFRIVADNGRTLKCNAHGLEAEKQMSQERSR